MYLWKYSRDSLGLYLSTITNCTKFLHCFFGIFRYVSCHSRHAISYRYTHTRSMDIRKNFLSYICHVGCSTLYVIDSQSLCNCGKIELTNDLFLFLSIVSVYSSWIDIGQSVIRFNMHVNVRSVEYF